MDALARQGRIFNQSNSGAATCAPSGAMLMPARYSARTGFAFRLMPAGMGRAVSRIFNNMERSLPLSIDQSNVAGHKPPYELQGLPPEEFTIAEL